jgi:hypothetical protein
LWTKPNVSSARLAVFAVKSEWKHQVTPIQSSLFSRLCACPERTRPPGGSDDAVAAIRLRFKQDLQMQKCGIGARCGTERLIIVLSWLQLNDINPELKGAMLAPRWLQHVRIPDDRTHA